MFSAIFPGFRSRILYNPKEIDYTEHDLKDHINTKERKVMKKFLEEFKAFISKGDVVSMAVGLMVGSAFTSIITSLNTNIIAPILGIIMGGVDFSGISFTLGAEEIEVGIFIQSVFNFLITAFVLFLVVKLFNNFKKKEEAKPTPPPAEPEDVKLLKEIRDLLKEQK